jgi:hypothetical protein
MFGPGLAPLVALAVTLRTETPTAAGDAHPGTGLGTGAARVPSRHLSGGPVQA